MKDLFEIITLLKEIKTLKTDQEVADLLNINRRTFETDKFRGKIPYKEIISFCSREGISTDKIFIGIKANNFCHELYEICKDLEPPRQDDILKIAEMYRKERDETKIKKAG